MNIKIRKIAAVACVGFTLGATVMAFTAQAGTTRFHGFCNHAAEQGVENANGAAHGNAAKHGC